MSRLHISTGESITLVKAGHAPVYVRSVLVFTDGTNDALFQISDKDGNLFAEPFTVNGADEHGGIAQLNEVVHAGPQDAKATLSGTGAKATVYYAEVR